MNKNILKLRIILWLLLWWVVAWFFYMGIVPSGEISYVFDFEKKSSFISRLNPDTRLEFGNKKFENIIVKDPVYFTLSTPRRFEKAILNIKYKNTKELSPKDKQIIEAGILVDKNIWRYDLRTVENNIIDSLELVWDKTRQDDLILLSRPQNEIASNTVVFDSIDDFLTNFDNVEKLAVYNFNFKKNYLIENYQPYIIEDVFSEENIKEQFTEINIPLRDDYQFFTFIQNEELDFDFEFIDLNKNKDKDNVDIHLYYDDYLIAANHLDDDGIVVDNGLQSISRKLKMKVPNLPTGTYKIEVRCNDDIITKNIRTKQKKIAFINKVNLAKKNLIENLDNVSSTEKIINVFTNSKRVHLKTIYPDSLQKIDLEGNLFDLNKTYTQFDQEVVRKASSSEYLKLIFEKSGIMLAGNGVFGFSQNALFEPRIKKVDRNLDILEDDIDFVLADYPEKEKEGDWNIAKIEFDLTKAYSEENKYNFIISIPGLEEQENKIELKEIKIDLKGNSLENKIKNY